MLRPRPDPSSDKAHVPLPTTSPQLLHPIQSLPDVVASLMSCPPYTAGGGQVSVRELPCQRLRDRHIPAHSARLPSSSITAICSLHSPTSRIRIAPHYSHRTYTHHARPPRARRRRCPARLLAGPANPAKVRRRRTLPRRDAELDSLLLAASASVTRVSVGATARATPTRSHPRSRRAWDVG
ncbi:hypothetical protein K523DRAFT_152155 [Schizophyllum commune Tattone D]|nr:hypothetical protein K523DRAFT_152155 [Schizophyllum commune Tattone D]